MAGFDYDVVVIGSGFGGSVAAFRAAEKGYRVGVMESGKRWNDEDVVKQARPAGPRGHPEVWPGKRDPEKIHITPG